MDPLTTHTRRSLRASQQKQLDILCAVDKICQQHGIEYWLDGGTLLGAVRHGGFIPWDDDIDIAMTKENLTRFCQIAPQELPPHLILQTPATTPHSIIVKVRDIQTLCLEPSDDLAESYNKGLYIDIFPFVPYPSCSRAFTRRITRNICRAYSILHRKHYYSLRATAEYLYFGTIYALCRAIWAVTYKICPPLSHYGNVPVNNGYGVKHRNDETWPLTTITFEGHTFPCPKDSHAYLTELYGDYMTPPDEDQRTAHAILLLPALDHE